MSSGETRSGPWLFSFSSSSPGVTGPSTIHVARDTYRVGGEAVPSGRSAARASADRPIASGHASALIASALHRSL